MLAGFSNLTELQHSYTLGFFFINLNDSIRRFDLLAIAKMTPWVNTGTPRRHGQEKQR